MLCPFVVAFIAGCLGDASVNVSGKVVDPQGNPIDGAEVDVSIESQKNSLGPDLSSHGGKFHVLQPYSPPHFQKDKFILVARKAGFERYSEELDSSTREHWGHQITLHPAKQHPVTKIKTD
jgi:hypothetical protein